MNTTLPYTQAVNTALAEALAADPSVMLVTEGESAASLAAAAVAQDRVLALPIADRAAIAVATGLAWAGRKVVVELASSGRLLAVAESLAEAARPRGGVVATLVLRVPVGTEAGLLDAPSLDLLCAIPGVRAVVPRDGGSAAALLRAALATAGVTVLLEPRALAPQSGPVGDGLATLDAQVVRPGTHAVVVAWGAGVHEAWVAADALEPSGVDLCVVDLVALTPLAPISWSRELLAAGRLVIASDDAALATRLLASVLGPAFEYLESPPVIVSANADVIADAVRASLSY